ncbi:MAG: sulfurtransferase [Myxococcales bacterium]|nr:sulfurtransferase [Myxococcales bacterium]MCB9716860.1 sulfurtransferase [Myxococcales bacterium]
MRSSLAPRVLSLVVVLASACGDDGAPAGDDATTGPGHDGTDGGPTDIDESGSASDGSTADPPDTATTDDTSPELCVEPLQAECIPLRGVISPDQLELFLGSDDLMLVDTRIAPAFETSHLPGAVPIDPTALRANVDGVAGQVAPEPEARAVLEAAGLTPELAVVVYGADNGTDPARVLWTLAYYGHQGPLWMLDGGFDPWAAQGRPTVTEPTPLVPSRYATAIDDGLRVDQQWVLDHLDDPGVTLVDARSMGEYDGGHIPGALSVDWTRNLADGGRFLPLPELLALYGEPPAGQTLVTYCQTGSRASVDWLALAWLGYADVRLYDGSWSEWSADPSNPVEP